MRRISQNYTIDNPQNNYDLRSINSHSSNRLRGLSLTLISAQNKRQKTIFNFSEHARQYIDNVAMSNLYNNNRIYNSDICNNSPFKQQFENIFRSCDHKKESTQTRESKKIFPQTNKQEEQKQHTFIHNDQKSDENQINSYFNSSISSSQKSDLQHNKRLTPISDNLNAQIKTAYSKFDQPQNKPPLYYQNINLPLNILNSRDQYLKFKLLPPPLPPPPVQILSSASSSSSSNRSQQSWFHLKSPHRFVYNHDDSSPKGYHKCQCSKLRCSKYCPCFYAYSQQCIPGKCCENCIKNKKQIYVRKLKYNRLNEQKHTIQVDQYFQNKKYDQQRQDEQIRTLDKQDKKNNVEMVINKLIRQKQKQNNKRKQFISVVSKQQSNRIKNIINNKYTHQDYHKLLNKPRNTHKLQVLNKNKQSIISNTVNKQQKMINEQNNNELQNQLIHQHQYKVWVHQQSISEQSQLISKQCQMIQQQQQKIQIINKQQIKQQKKIQQQPSTSYTQFNSKPKQLQFTHESISQPIFNQLQMQSIHHNYQSIKYTDFQFNQYNNNQSNKFTINQQQKKTNKYNQPLKSTNHYNYNYNQPIQYTDKQSIKSTNKQQIKPIIYKPRKLNRKKQIYKCTCINCKCQTFACNCRRRNKYCSDYCSCNYLQCKNLNPNNYNFMQQEIQKQSIKSKISSQSLSNDMTLQTPNFDNYI